MDKNNLKCIVGQVHENQPAIIRFFDSVDWWSVDSFKEEFLWLQDYVHPSKIIVLINSDGGSVVQGMSAYSLISECPIEVDCVIEGLAASMGSIIWAAGKNLYMHDYSILMIHNPWMGGDQEDPNTKAIIEAFKNQLKTIYCKRFGLSEEEITSIMDGAEGVDGTYFNAEKAVAQGFIPASHVIETPQSAKAQLFAELESAVQSHCTVDLRKIAAKVNDSLDPAEILTSLGVKDENYNTINNQMKKEFLSIAAFLGFEGENVQVEAVQSKIIELMNAQKEVETVKAECEALKGKVMAHETTIENLQASLNKANDALKVYEDAEKARKDAEINAMIDAAIEAGKIKAEKKEQWVNFFGSNFDMAKDALDAIPSVVAISQQIADDEKAKKDAEAKAAAIEEAKKKADEAAAKAGVADYEFKKF